MADKVRIVAVGCGGISPAWFEPAVDHPDIEIVGLVDLKIEAAEKRKEEFGFKEAVVSTDLESILTTVKPDAVFDITLPEGHMPTAVMAMEHGCHVLGEKPLADSMENARKIVETSKKTGKIHMVIQNRRYDPRIRGLRNFIASGKIGKLTTLNSDFYIGAHFGGFREKMQHVLLLDMAIHTLDTARFFVGSDPVAVYCKEWNPEGSWYQHGASAVAVFEMSDGVVYTYRGSWCSDGLHTSWESEWRAIGTGGTVTWDGHDTYKAQRVVKVESFTAEFADEEVPLATDGKEGGHRGLIKDFIECIKTGETPETVCSDNIKSLAMVFAAIKSAETGERVKVEL